MMSGNEPAVLITCRDHGKVNSFSASKRRPRSKSISQGFQVMSQAKMLGYEPEGKAAVEVCQLPRDAGFRARERERAPFRERERERAPFSERERETERVYWCVRERYRQREHLHPL